MNLPLSLQRASIPFEYLSISTLCNRSLLRRTSYPTQSLSNCYVLEMLHLQRCSVLSSAYDGSVRLKCLALD